VAAASGWEMEFVEGNAELTPSRLVGAHDPALVLERGYLPEAFTEGPLVAALREGSLLYIEELNRVPEETLNVLITALAEGEIHVPRLGHIPASPRFRLIAPMNPFDPVGTGSSVRGAIDMVLLARGLEELRGEAGFDTLLDAALAAFSGRIRVEEGRTETPEEIVAALLAGIVEERRGAGEGDPPKASDPPP